MSDPLNPQARGTLSYGDDRNPKHRKSWSGSENVTITALTPACFTVQGNSIQMTSPKYGSFVMSFVCKVDLQR